MEDKNCLNCKNANLDCNHVKCNADVPKWVNDPSKCVRISDSFKTELSDTIVKFSDGKLTKIKADKLSDDAVAYIDFYNSALMHKGINWLARKIINMIDFKKLELEDEK